MTLPPEESLNLEPSSSSRHDFRMDDDSGLHRRKKTQTEKTKPERTESSQVTPQWKHFSIEFQFPN
jgi:hypothetical protein